MSQRVEVKSNNIISNKVSYFDLQSTEAPILLGQKLSAYLSKIWHFPEETTDLTEH